MSQVSIIDIEGNNPQIPTQFNANTGFAVPLGNILEVYGDIVAAAGVPVSTFGTGNNIMTLVQLSSNSNSSLIANAGLASFDSTQFAVDSNGFVQLSGGGAGETITGNNGIAVSPSGSNWNLVTANSTPKFVGVAIGSTITLDFNLSNLVLGSSLPLLTGGIYNTGLGNGVLASVTVGSYNSCIGASCGTAIDTATKNSGIGVGALERVVSSPSNVGIGYSALNSLTAGSGVNTACGTQALAQIATGKYNIGLGYQAGYNYTLASASNICIGNTGTLGESNIIRIGTQGSGDGQQTDCYLAGILHTTSGRTRNVTVPGAYPYTVLSTDDIVSVSTAAAARTIYIPNAPSSGTASYVIKDVSGNAAANAISVTTPGGTVTIDGATTYTINSDYGAISVYFNGSNYFII